MKKIFGLYWFESKTTQVDPPGFTAFGISCRDRYGGKGQVVDMLNFCEACAREELEHLVESVFFDKCQCYIVTYDCRLEYIHTIAEIAVRTIKHGQAVVNGTAL